MVHGAENEPVGGPLREAANCGLDGRKLSLLPIGIGENPGRIKRKEARDFLGLCSQYNPGYVHPWVARGRNKMLGKSFPAIFKQRFGLAHAPGFTGGENRDGQHSAQSRCKLASSESFTDLLGKFSALRRTAMSAAVMLTAISSGVSAPMSKPTGAWTRSNLSSDVPCFWRAL